MLPLVGNCGGFFLPADSARVDFLGKFLQMSVFWGGGTGG
jgi:hypothetical protein